MTAFLIGAALLVIVTIAILVRPLLRNAATDDYTQSQLNTAIYRDQMGELDRDRAENILSQEDYDQSRAELQRRMLDDVREDTPRAAASSGKLVSVVLGSALLVSSAALYLIIGTPQAINPPPPPAQEQKFSLEDINRMVDGLAARLQTEPQNYEGWAMLARSYKMLGRYPEALAAYQRTGPLLDSNAQLLVDHADTLAAVERSFTPAVLDLINRALKLDPANPQGLWLRGTAAFEAKRYDQAISDWEKLLAIFPPGSQEAGVIRNNIAEARSLAGQAASPAAR